MKGNGGDTSSESSPVHAPISTDAVNLNHTDTESELSLSDDAFDDDDLSSLSSESELSLSDNDFDDDLSTSQDQSVEFAEITSSESELSLSDSDNNFSHIMSDSLPEESSESEKMAQEVEAAATSVSSSGGIPKKRKGNLLEAGTVSKRSKYVQAFPSGNTSESLSAIGDLSSSDFDHTGSYSTSSQSVQSLSDNEFDDDDLSTSQGQPAGLAETTSLESETTSSESDSENNRLPDSWPKVDESSEGELTDARNEVPGSLEENENPSEKFGSLYS